MYAVPKELQNRIHLKTDLTDFPACGPFGFTQQREKKSSFHFSPLIFPSSRVKNPTFVKRFSLIFSLTGETNVIVLSRTYIQLLIKLYRSVKDLSNPIALVLLH